MENKISLHELSSLSDDARTLLLTRTEDDLSEFIAQVAPIVEAVRTEGDEAIARYTRQFDNAPVRADDLAASDADFEAAFAALDDELIDTLDYAADNIRRYHQQQMPQSLWMKEIRPGVLAGERVTAIESVACYSPRGKGSFPSVTLMTSIPAVVAGVDNPIILTPPGRDGRIDPATLVAARLAGVDRVYKAGGAMAVAAAAYGTQTIPPCRKIEGPGSPWFAAARRLLADKIESRLPAGPSESIVLADPTANPNLAAMDVIIESEHGADSSAFLVTWSRDIADAAMTAIPGYWAHMDAQHVAFSAAVLGGNRGGIVLCEDAQQAYDFINDYAPEHLEVLSKTPFDHLAHIRNAAEILLGEYAAGSIANYMMGPNCVLPTAGAAKTHSPLGVEDFLKRTSIGHFTREGFDEMAPHTYRFASYEGFPAHANAVSSLRRNEFE